MDVNTQALNKQLQKQEQQEKFLDMFESEIAPDLEMIQVLIKRIRRLSKDFYGFNLQNEAEELIHDLI